MYLLRLRFTGFVFETHFTQGNVCSYVCFDVRHKSNAIKRLKGAPVYREPYLVRKRSMIESGSERDTLSSEMHNNYQHTATFYLDWNHITFRFRITSLCTFLNNKNNNRKILELNHTNDTGISNHLV